jgi:glycosyltransferase involved in cell wall biosynthesis
MRYIYWFPYYNKNSPSVRYRATYVIDELQRRYQVKVKIIYPSGILKSFFPFLSLYFEALFFRKKNSFIFFQKIYTNGIYALLLKILILARKRNTVYDIDDAEYIRYNPGTIKFFIKHSQFIIVGSETLRNYAEKLSQNVFLIGSPVIAHNEVKKERNSIFTIGWLGYYNWQNEKTKHVSHKKSLEQFIFPAVKRLNFPVKLVLLGNLSENEKNELNRFFLSNRNIELEIPEVDWLDESKIYSRIKTFDIGVFPLINHEFNSAKSAFKLKQYFSCGVPALANDVGENSKYIKNGQNGYLCEDSEGYYNRLTDVHQMNDFEYCCLSTNAKKTTENCMENYCDQLMDILTN